MNISVALCTYNGEKHLKEQLESIASQTLLPSQLVICDDRSSDGTLAIIEEFKKTAPFSIEVYKNEAQLGVTANFFKAISLCNGEFIALCDQDDTWLPQKLETLFKKFQSPPSTKLIFSDLELVDETLLPLGGTMWQYLDFNKHKKENWLGKKQHDFLLQYGNVVTGASVMLHSSLKEKISLFKEYEFKLFLHDYILALIAGLHNGLNFVDQCLVKYRQHTNQQLGTRAKKLPVSGRFKQLRLLKSKKHRQLGIEILETKFKELSIIGINENNSEYYRVGVKHLKLRTKKTNWFLKTTLLTGEFFKGRYRLYGHSAFLSYFNDIF